MRRTLIAAGGLVVVAVAPYPQAAEASCVAPTLEVVGRQAAPVVLHRGERVAVRGRGFVDGCDDTGAGERTFGCLGGNDGDEEAERPLQDLELVLLQGQPVMEQTTLATADAGTAADGRLGQVAWSVVVPGDQRLGRAVLKTEGSEPLRVRIAR